MIAHMSTLSKHPGNFVPGVPPSICLHRTVDPVASCTLVILVHTPLWTVELHRPCVHTRTCDTWTYTLTLCRTDPVSWQPLLNLDFVYIAVNTDFLWVWFAFSPCPCFGVPMDVCGTPPPPGSLPWGSTCSVVKGRSEGGFVASPQLCFLWLLGKHLHTGRNTYTKRG